MKLALILLLSLTALAADEAKPANQPVPEVVRLRLVNGYQKAMMSQDKLTKARDRACAKDPDCKKAQDEFNADVTSLQITYRQAMSDLKVPSGEEIAVDPNASVDSQVQIRKVPSAK